MNAIKVNFSILLKCAMICFLFITTYTMVLSKSAEAASWKPIDSNWQYRVDAPLSDGGKENEYHVHVRGKVNGKMVEGSETVNGGTSHKTTLTKSGVPKWVQDKVKSTKDFKNAKSKQDKLDAAKKAAKKFSWTKLLFDPKPIITIATLIGVTIYTFSMSTWHSLIYS